jgi:hypothetical protein
MSRSPISRLLVKTAAQASPAKHEKQLPLLTATQKKIDSVVFKNTKILLGYFSCSRDAEGPHCCHQNKFSSLGRGACFLAPRPPRRSEQHGGAAQINCRSITSIAKRYNLGKVSSCRTRRSIGCVNTAQTQHHLKRKRHQYALSQQKRLIVSEVFEKAKVFGPSVFLFCSCLRAAESPPCCHKKKKKRKILF